MTSPTLRTAEPHVSGYTIRPVTLDDIPAYLPFISGSLIEVFGASDITADDIHTEWTDPKFDLVKSTRAAFAPDGTLAAYAEVHDTSSLPVRPRIWGHTAPEYRGNGLGTALIQWAIQRAHDVLTRVPDHARVVIEAWSNRRTPGVAELLRANGFATNRHSYNMHIELESAPEPVSFPQGFRVVTYNEYPELRRFVETHVACFRDHRGFVDTPVDERMEHWEHFLASARTDPALWMLLLEGDTPAGIVVGIPRDDTDPEMGWIDIVGIVREYRRRGLATLLLRYAFNAYWARGIRKVGLGVDGHSLTNATQLYEKAGMHVAHIWDAYEREIRPGEELSRQS